MREQEEPAKERLLSCLLQWKLKKKVQNGNNSVITFANVSSALRQCKKLEFMCHAMWSENAAQQMPQELGDIYLSDMSTLLKASSNSHSLQKALLTAEVECTVGSNDEQTTCNLENTHVNVRKRWIRFVLSLSSSVINTICETTTKGKSVEECANDDEFHLINLHVRVVELSTHSAEKTLECTTSANTSQLTNTDFALGSFEAIIAKSEMQLAQELISTLHELSCLLRNKTMTIEQINNLFHVNVPVYSLHVHMYDSAATRLCEVGKCTNEIIDCFVDSTVWEETCTRTSNDSSIDCISTVNNKLATWLMLHWNTHVLQLLYELLCSFSVKCTNTSTNDTTINDDKYWEFWKYTLHREQCADSIDVLLTFLQFVMKTYNNTHISSDCDDSTRVFSEMQNIWALLSTHFTNKQLNILHPPSVLLHCVQGISRSPSIILLYLLHRLQDWHKRTSRTHECFEELNHNNCNSTTMMNVTKEQIELITLLDCLDAIRSVRPCVQPNIAFMMELQSLWRHSFHK